MHDRKLPNLSNRHATNENCQSIEWRYTLYTYYKHSEIIAAFCNCQSWAYECRHPCGNTPPPLPPPPHLLSSSAQWVTGRREVRTVSLCAHTHRHTCLVYEWVRAACFRRLYVCVCGVLTVHPHTPTLSTHLYRLLPCADVSCVDTGYLASPLGDSRNYSKGHQKSPKSFCFCYLRKIQARTVYSDIYFYNFCEYFILQMFTN